MGGASAQTSTTSALGRPGKACCTVTLSVTLQPFWSVMVTVNVPPVPDRMVGDWMFAAFNTADGCHW